MTDAEATARYIAERRGATSWRVRDQKADIVITGSNRLSEARAREIAALHNAIDRRKR